MKIRLYNAKIMTAEKDCSIFNGELYTDGDKISYVGTEKKMPDLTGK